MLDLSTAIAWAAPSVGASVAIGLGLRAADKGRATYAGVAFGVAIALGFGFSYLQAALLSVCIEDLRLCPNRGDGNMGYWFQSLAATPIFWLGGWAAWAARRRA